MKGRTNLQVVGDIIWSGTLTASLTIASHYANNISITAVVDAHLPVFPYSTNWICMKLCIMYRYFTLLACIICQGEC